MSDTSKLLVCSASVVPYPIADTLLNIHCQGVSVSCLIRCGADVTYLSKEQRYELMLMYRLQLRDIRLWFDAGHDYS